MVTVETLIQGQSIDYCIPVERIPQLAEVEMTVHLSVEEVDAILGELQSINIFVSTVPSPLPYLLCAVSSTVSRHLKVLLIGRNRIGVAIDHSYLHDSSVVRSEEIKYQHPEIKA